MSLESLAAAFEAHNGAAILAAAQGLDVAEQQKILGRTKVNAYGISCGTPELRYYAESAALLVLLLAPTHPKAMALRGELTSFRFSPRLEAPIPLPAAGFSGWPALERLELEHAVFDVPLDLRSLPKLARVTLEDTTLSAGVLLPDVTTDLFLRRVTGVPTLTGLGAGLGLIWVDDPTDLTNLGALDTLPRLRTLGVRDAPRLVSFGTGTATSLESLTIEGCPLITSLQGLPTSQRKLHLKDLPIPSLRGVTLHPRAELQVVDCPLRTLEGLPRLSTSVWKIVGRDLASLDGIEALSELTELTVEARALTELSALGRLPKLAHLTLVGVPLRDLGALRACPALQQLTLREMDVDTATLPTTLRAIDLRNCGAIVDVSPLVRQADLRAVALHSTAVTPESVPSALSWACSWEADADLPKLARRARPKPGAKPKVDPALFADLVSLDAAVAHAALSRMDAGAFDELLKFARATHAGLETTHPLLEKQPHVSLLLRALVLYAPADLPRAQELRAGVTFEWKPRESYSGLWPVDAALFTRFPNLRWITLDGVSLSNPAALAGIPLRSLDLSNGELGSPEALGAISSLEYLKLRGIPVKRVGIAPSLKSLTWIDAPDLVDLRGFADNAVTSLTIEGCALVSLDGIAAFPAISTLDLRHVDGLSSLAPLAGLRALDFLDISGCDAIRSLVGVPGPKRLRVRACAGFETLRGLTPSATTPQVEICGRALTTLDGIEAWSGIEELSVNGCRNLTDVGALDGLPVLRALDARDCPALRDLPLRRCGALRVVMTAGSGITTDSVPEPIRWTCCTDRYGRMDKLALRIPPTPAVVSNADKGQVQSIARLLRAPDVQSVDQGLALLAALGDPGMWDALLEGSEVEASSRYRSYARIVSKRYTGTLAPYVLLGLVRTAPKTCARAEAIRAGITGLTAYGTRDEEGRRPFNPAHLEGLPLLERLLLDRVGPFTKNGDVPSLPALRNVHLSEITGLDDLWWLANAPNLESVSLERTPVRRLDGLAGAPKLRKLTCHRNPLADLSPLLTMPALAAVGIAFQGALPPVLETLAARGVDLHGW